MSKTKLIFTYFDIKEFGVYSNKGKRDKRFFPDVGDIFDSLSKWVDGKMVGNTKVMDKDPDNGYFPLYCYSVLKDGDDNFLVTVWNESQTSEGKLGRLKSNSRVGKIEVSETEFDEEDIPGYPSYYYIIPSKNVVINIRKENGSARSVEFADYVKKYIGRFSEYANYNKAEVSEGPVDVRDRLFLGLSVNGEKPSLDLNEKFTIRMSYQKKNKRDILKLYSQVRKLVMSSKLSVSHAATDKNVNIIYKAFGIKKIKFGKEDLKLRTEIDYTPSEDEMKNMYDVWLKESAIKDSNIRYGVKLKGKSSKVEWLGGTLMRDNFEVGDDIDELEISEKLLVILARDEIKKKMKLHLKSIK
ncbi:hypothetical protein ABMA67_00540 [Halobacteriovorax sp. RZ-3]|uniref:hypothetical protein n=1 Tax=Halobacteriovorax sp. RZ-3 TaxID=3157720 RepID=UPI003713DC44